MPQKKRLKVYNNAQPKKYFCFVCKIECEPDQIWFYVDGNNGAVTKNAKGYCKECK